MHSLAKARVASLLFMITFGAASAQEFTTDANTLLLLLHGNGNALGAAGDSALLQYAAAGNLSMAAGTVEFWLKPHWDRNDGQTHVILARGTWGGLMLAKDGADNLRIMVNRWSDNGLPERGASCNVTGRCGDTHSPPNTLGGYDYENPTVVLSDIADWTADGSGAFAPVNVDTWGSLSWPWPDGVMDFSQRVETQWYLYWLMSLPGHDNGLALEVEAITNWWEFIGNWDEAIAACHGLHGPDSAAAAPQPDETTVLPMIRALRARPAQGDVSFAETVPFTWDACDDAGRSVAAGTYLVRVRDDARRATHKVAIIR